MSRGPKLTEGIIADVKEYAAKYPMLAYADIGRIGGVSASSVGRILKGKYDRREAEIADDASGDGYMEQTINLLREIKAGIELLLDK